MSNPHQTTGSGSPISANELLTMYYLDLRSALLEAAAGIDRIERAGGADVLNDPRIEALVTAAEIIRDGEPHRAERILQTLSVD